MVRDRNVRVCLQKTSQSVSQKVHGGTVVGDDAKRAGLAAYKRFKTAKHDVNVAVDPTGALPHDFAGRSHRHALRRPCEKCYAQVRFESFDAGAHRGRTQMYASGPSREIAFVSNGAKGFEIG